VKGINMNVSQLMSSTVVSVEMDDSLTKVRSIFEETNFHHLLVVERGKLLGIISDRDLLKSLSPRLRTASETAKDLATLNKKAHQIMSRKLITLDEGASIKAAVKVFNEQSISCIPIIKKDQSLAGMLSWRDIMRAVAISFDQHST
jgi:acetoin utilization protein AcuB